MEPMTVTAKVRPEEAVDQQGQPKTGNILGLPNELLLQVISFLSPGSIRNLMVNRSLRSFCEQGLYKGISLSNHPRRSIRLLETFLSRPDLALLVRHLEIELSWLYPRLFPPSQVPLVLQPDGLEALCLAKNIQSLSLSGVAGWIWEPEMAKFREAIFKMKLVRLHIPFIRDPHTVHSCTWPGSSVIEDNWDGDLGDEIRKLFQAQPLLEEFKLSGMSITYETSASLRDKLKNSDVPSLKALQASPEVALAFLPVADRLENLNLTIADWDDRLFSDMETGSTGIGLSIRRFSIRVWGSFYNHSWFWKNLAKVFSLFPNTEQLLVTVNSLTSQKEVEPAQYYFNIIAENAYVLPSLRDAELRFETPFPDTPGIFEVQIQSVLRFRIACPLLETVIDPMKRLWTFRADHKNPRGFTPQLFGRLIEARLGPVNDLKGPQDS